MVDAAMARRAFVVVTMLVVSRLTTIQAAPLGRVVLKGRLRGDVAWSSWLFPAPGDVVEYRLRVDLADVGASNGINTVITDFRSGFQSLSLQIRQDAAAPIQVSFDLPLASPNALASFQNGWADGMGASAGTPMPRPGGVGNDLTGIWAVHAPGVFSGADFETIIARSTFRITRAIASSFTALTPSWGTASGAMRINAVDEILITPEGQNGPDPLIAFFPLRLGIPEPGTIVLAACGGVAAFFFARSGRKAGIKSSFELSTKEFRNHEGDEEHEAS